MKEAYFVLYTELNPFVDVMQQEVARVKKEKHYLQILHGIGKLCVYLQAKDNEIINNVEYQSLILQQ